MRAPHWLGVVGVIALTLGASAEDWPRFRGPTGQGISGETDLPIHWSVTEHVAWKTEVPGEGWSSPIIFGSRVFVTVARDAGVACHVVCLDRDSGKTLWDVKVFDQVPSRKQQQNSYATPTPVCDGDRVYAFFGGGGAVALSLDGKIVWTNTENSFYSQHGLGASPIVYQNLLLMPWDPSIKDGPEKRIGWQIPWDKAYVWALDKHTGKERYRAMRGSSRIGHMSPLIAKVDGADQLISSAGDTVAGFDPQNGKRLWWVETGGEGVVPSPVIADGVVISSSGFPTPVNNQKIYAALRAFKMGGSGDVTKSNLVWEQRKNPPMISSVATAGGLVYSVKEDGRAQCLDVADGKIVWEKRLRGTYSASPVVADGHVYFTSDSADTTVVDAGRAFKEVGFNEIGERCQASLAVSKGRIILRTEKNVYCFAKG